MKFEIATAVSLTDKSDIRAVYAPLTTGLFIGRIVRCGDFFGVIFCRDDYCDHDDVLNASSYLPLHMVDEIYYRDIVNWEDNENED